jgi:hypothetical protein
MPSKLKPVDTLPELILGLISGETSSLPIRHPVMSTIGQSETAVADFLAHSPMKRFILSSLPPSTSNENSFLTLAFRLLRATPQDTKLLTQLLAVSLYALSAIREDATIDSQKILQIS